VAGGPFFDPEADAALISALLSGLANPLVEVEVVESDINDLDLARAMADELDALVHGSTGKVPTELGQE
jgi:uncharacterized protein (UPF0261 family)